MAAPHTRQTRTEDEVLAAATAGHVMAGMPPTAADVDAARRVLRGESTVDEELAQLRDEFRRRRS
ncbi:antitoxin VbhA family protein [Gordonia sp. KTR9]|uniref:antitoxin VbhA family protein n=1 Tax=Gordonia sp. KTR9 TaxID=337191 RepID=UPI0009FBF64D|nr:antitoxin VbhA family protein [Gordonia sp. KTR9]